MPRMSSSIPMPRTIVCKELDSSQHDGLVLVATSSIFLENFEGNTAHVYESLSSGSNLPHAAITEALSPALKLDKAAESKVGISLGMNHASSPINNKCATLLCLTVWCPVSAHYHFFLSPSPRPYSILSGMRCWRGLAMPEADLFPHWAS